MIPQVHPSTSRLPRALPPLPRAQLPFPLIPRRGRGAGGEGQSQRIVAFSKQSQRDLHHAPSAVAASGARTTARSHPFASLSIIAAALAAIALNSSVRADDAPLPDNPAPTESIPDSPTESPATETITLMQTAGQRLADARLDEETTQLHDDIIARLRQALDQAQQQAVRPLPQPGPSSESQNGGSQSATGGTGEQGARSPDTFQAAESSDRPGEAELDQSEIERRRNLATSVWGHLPPRERERMEGAFSERFLPQYDDLVRRYYEALATDPTE